MSADISRDTFRAERDYAGVVMQQGRVQLDADWNEQAAILDRRLRAAAIDLAGRAIVPAATPDAFRIDRTGTDFTIGPGRLYVDGLVAENRGSGAAQWDPALAEWRGGGPMPWTDQPWADAPPPVTTVGAMLVYLEVWRREVTYLEAPELIEPAVGVDTAARLQTVWRVRAADIGGASCAAAADAPAWAALTAPSPARLTVGTTEVTPVSDPCLVPPAGGYRGLENQLYRVEVHRGGPIGTASFKWSRDNGSVAVRVARIEGGGSRLVLDSLGRDERLGLRAGDWVEFSDPGRALAGEPGVLRRIAPAGGVEAATATVTLSAPLPATHIPADGIAAPGTLLRRWDQAGRVLRDDGGLIDDLDAPGAAGDITIPVAGTAVALEDGISVAFALDGGDAFRTGDWWLFAARAADASVDPLDHAAPHGPHRHYARLAIVSAQGIEDCRQHWPADRGDGCGCTITVAAGEDLAPLAERMPADRQLQICLSAGEYRLSKPLVLDGGGTGNLRITGCGLATRLLAGGEAALILSHWASVEVTALAVTAGKAETGRLDGIGILGAITTRDCGTVTITSIDARAAGGAPASCLRLHGGLNETGIPLMSLARVRDCTLVAGTDGTGLLVSGARTSEIAGNRVLAAPAVRGTARPGKPRAILLWPRTIAEAGRERAASRGKLAPPDGYVETTITAGAITAKVQVPEPLVDAWQALYRERGNFRSTRVLAADIAKRKRKLDQARGRGGGKPFEDWYAGATGSVRRGAPAAGLVVAGAAAREVCVSDNEVEGCRAGIRVAISRQAPRSERLSIGRVTLRGNRVTLPGKGDGALVGLFVGNADETRILANSIAVADIKKPIVGEGIRVYGTLGRMLTIRDNHVSGLRTGVLVVPVPPIPRKPFWTVADNLLESAADPVPDFVNGRITNNWA
ncbi:DUF6519 domain-containing protein [Sphingomonas sp. 1P06PA]|uniref:DUF6519 domain-containing protein n=1 Tax=Sphingomonas sp. 1P06PA TaxID=554121 RepID=UPI0039A69D11